MCIIGNHSVGSPTGEQAEMIDMCTSPSIVVVSRMLMLRAGSRSL